MRNIAACLVLAVIICAGCNNASPRQMKIDSFSTMDDFGIRASSLFLYYEDLDRALDFYSNILGMEVVADYKMAYILRMSSDSYLILVDESKGMHSAEEPKTVALALLTGQLGQWYQYLLTQEVEIKYEYQSKEGSAHDGFVVVDPEGYLLEFEQFNQHPENERFIPILNRNKKKSIQSARESKLPEGLSIHSTITWLYYKDLLAMQNFYEDKLGLVSGGGPGLDKNLQSLRNRVFGSCGREKRNAFIHNEKSSEHGIYHRRPGRMV